MIGGVAEEHRKRRLSGSGCPHGLFRRGLRQFGLFAQRAAAIRWDNMRQQEIRDPLVSVDLVLNTGEAVAFVVVNFVVDGAAAFLDRLHHLLSFRFRAARIVPSGQ